MIDLDRARRLQQARRLAGFARAVDAIAAYGWNRSTYFGHENGARGISRDRLETYSRSFRVNLEWLAYGRGPQRPGRRTLIIEGHVIDHGMIQGRNTENEIIEVALPEEISGMFEPQRFIAYQVQGHGNYPTWADGDILLALRDHGTPDQYLGRQCAIRLRAGTQLIRRLCAGSRAGLFILLAANLPPMVDVEIDSAAPIMITLLGALFS